jgi:CRISPR/Cas system CSM-associated protein Csm3 (group 7 of RAMP superfamily)
MYDQARAPVAADINRWQLTGTLTTLSPLHIGDGERLPLGTRGVVGDARDGKAEFATVFTRSDGKPIIPGTSIKGALHAWAQRHKHNEHWVSRIFGTAAQAGRVTFHDAWLARFNSPKEDEVIRRGWLPKRGTAILPHVVIDPETRSAKHGLLFHVEYVPPASDFSVRFTAVGLTDEEKTAFLAMLNAAFASGAPPARLGGETADGWGRVQWKAAEVRLFDPQRWLASPARHWTDVLTTLREPERSKWLHTRGLTAAPSSLDPSLQIELKLRFDGPMLVNDPTRTQKADASGRGSITHAMIEDARGRPYVPAATARGALRSQARRIWQTLAHGGSEDLKESGICDSAPTRDSQKRLAEFWKMFGATGWRSPFEFEDLQLSGEPQEHRQEFVAIDRFTGGAAAEKKFNAVGLLKPCFAGMITLWPDRWESAGAAPWTWLLLAWTLRDWIEGDGTLGFGASKGWGHFHAEIDICGASAEGALLAGVLARDPSALADPRLEEWAQTLPSYMRRSS